MTKTVEIYVVCLELSFVHTCIAILIKDFMKTATNYYQDLFDKANFSQCK